MSGLAVRSDAGRRRSAGAASPGWRQVPMRFVAALVLLTLGGCGPTEPSTAEYGPNDMQIPPIDVPGARAAPVSIPAAFKLPQGKGPFPAVIVLHGCGGRGASQLIWAQRLNRWGYAALIPDSMTPRGVKRVCEPDAQELVTPRDRVADVGAAVAWLRTQPEIDSGRIAVLGLSHGGMTAVLATERTYAWFGLRAAVDYYGPCIDDAAHGNVPLLVLVGDADDWGHPAVRCEAFGKALKPEQPFQIVIYPGVYHAFDNPEMVRTISNNHIMEYNPPAAEDSYGRVHSFLDHWVRH